MTRITMLSIVFFSLFAEAKVFRNAYISFEMPDSWKCGLEQTEWVCRSDPDKFPKEAKEAIIILTAKEVGPTDTLDLYEQHLNSPIPMMGRGGTQSPSKVQYPAKRVTINDQIWIDGLHLGSEVGNYFTRYYATVKDRIAILVTFSSHQLYYTKYSSDFFKAIMSMRVIASKNILSRPDMGPIRPGGETIGTSISQHLQSDPMTMQESEEKSSGSNGITYLGIALLLAAIGTYLFIKNKKS